jgi:hypothetical protein
MVLKALYWHARRSSERHHPAHDDSRKESRWTGPLLASGAVSPRGPAGQADAEADPLAQVIPELSLAASARRLPQSTPVRFAAIRLMLYGRVPSRALGAGAGSIAVLPRALAGDTGAFLVPAEPRAARPAWPAEFSWSVYRYQNYWR